MMRAGWSSLSLLVENLFVSAELPRIDRESFEQQLEELAEQEFGPGVVDRLFLHYRELRRWNRRTSLVGPGTAREVLQRHYVESLAGTRLLDGNEREMVDIGSGAGFPGLILAAVRGHLSVTLVEANQKKWSFLMTASRKMSLPCRCLNARVGATPVEGLPPQIDVITSRAVSDSDLSLNTLLPRLSSHGSLLLWVGESIPKTPKNFTVKQEVLLSGSRARRILRLSPR